MITEKRRQQQNAASRRRNKNPARIAYLIAWHMAHPAKRSAYKKLYDATHREQQKAYRLANREKRQASKAAYYVANRAHLLAQVKARTDANKEAVLEYHRDHYRNNPARAKAWSAAWRAANPERRGQIENRRRVRKAGNGGSHTLDELQEKFAQFGNRCFYCGTGGKLTIDHDVPLIRGGTDDIANILPACRSCNSRKHDKTALEFIATGRTNHLAFVA